LFFFIYQIEIVFSLFFGLKSSMCIFFPSFNLNKLFSYVCVCVCVSFVFFCDCVISVQRCFVHRLGVIIFFLFPVLVQCLFGTYWNIWTLIIYRFDQWLSCQRFRSKDMSILITLILPHYFYAFFLLYVINLNIFTYFFTLILCFVFFVVLNLGMATKPIPVVTCPNQTQFDGFSPFWLGLSMSLGFPRFQNTGMGRVTGI